jgi:hypothetical protein
MWESAMAEVPGIILLISTGELQEQEAFLFPIPTAMFVLPLLQPGL